ncbi:MAG: hybrid sensor histidine kinase/response regulator [Nitrospirales bacterium]|nr:MAG: hybrid sensor histidine kinase/response regulator [Nitrospirales bacterium]
MRSTTHRETHSLKVLLIDDDEDDAMITQTLLHDVPGKHFEIDWAESYERGLEMMKEDTHDIGLIDYQLGGHSGIDLLHEIHGRGLQAPVILLTGQGNESVVLEAMRSGASDYIPKGSMSSETLERAIYHAVEKTKLQKTLGEHHRQLQQANANLVRKNEEIQRFYHVLAHELKTPLTAATEFVEIMLEGLAGPLTPDQQEYLEIVDECCDSLRQNINDLFDITRLETGKLSVDPQPNSLEHLIHHVVTSLTPTAQHKGIHLSYSLPSHLSTVIMDQHRVRQILNNLLSNALKYTSKDGEIRVEVTDDVEDETRVKIAISDTGPGIAKDQLEHIFDRLYQIRNDASPSVAGLGLGLFISQELAKLHGGTLSVHSSPGAGSVFFFSLRKSPQLKA